MGDPWRRLVSGSESPDTGGSESLTKGLGGALAKRLRVAARATARTSARGPPERWTDGPMSSCLPRAFPRRPCFVWRVSFFRPTIILCVAEQRKKIVKQRRGTAFYGSYLFVMGELKKILSMRVYGFPGPMLYSSTLEVTGLERSQSHCSM